MAEKKKLTSRAWKVWRQLDEAMGKLEFVEQRDLYHFLIEQLKADVKYVNLPFAAVVEGRVTTTLMENPKTAEEAALKAADDIGLDEGTKIRVYARDDSRFEFVVRNDGVERIVSDAD